MNFSHDLRDAVIAGDITLSIRLWQRPKVKVGGRYPVGPAVIEVDSIELVPFGSIRAEDVRLAGEQDLEALRRRAAHAGPIDASTVVYRIEFHLVDD
ncbi:MAG TPA: ASCH domain-containing protein [Streptosporangiaceae bacterium]|nr:ASCH domain-containing protein [Streptosporangiaceae bacterium]